MADQLLPSTPRQAQTQAQKQAQKRAQEKCDECRRKKIKCLPEARRWPGQKCDGCVQGGQACGPNCRRRGSDLSPTSTVFRDILSQQISQEILLEVDEDLGHTNLGVDTNEALNNAVAAGTQQAEDMIFNNLDINAGGGIGELGSVPPSQPPHGSLFNYNNNQRPVPDPYSNSDAYTPPGISWFRTQKIIDSKFILLGHLLELFRELLLRKRAATFINPPIRFAQYDDVEAAISTVLHIISVQFIDVFESILERLEEAPALESKIILHQLYENAEAYHSYHNNTTVNGKQAHSLKEYFVKLYRTVLDRLSNLYANHGDTPAAHRYRRRHAELSGLPLTTEVDSFFESSISTTEMFLKLRDLYDFTTHLPDPAKTKFPAAHAAALANRPAAAHALVNRPENDLSHFDILRRRVLHPAAETSDLRLLELVLQQKPDLLKERDIYNLTAVCIAAHTANADFFMRLVEAGAPTIVQDIVGRTLLSIACGGGSIEIVKYLLENGHDPNDDPEEICSPLHSAAASGHLQVVKLLLEKGAWPCWRSGGRFASKEARDRNHVEIASLLEEAERRQPANLASNHRLRSLLDHDSTTPDISPILAHARPSITFQNTSPENTTCSPIVSVSSRSTPMPSQMRQPSASPQPPTRPSPMPAPLRPTGVSRSNRTLGLPAAIPDSLSVASVTQRQSTK